MLQRFFHRSESYEPCIRLPSPGVQHWEHEPPEHLTLKVSRALLQNLHRKEGNRDFTLKRCTQNLMPTRTQEKSGNLVGPKAVVWSWRVSRRDWV